MQARLTKQYIAQLAQPAALPNQACAQRIIRDNQLPGFGVRVTNSGVKSYIVEKRVKGQSCRVTIGRVEYFDVAQARHHALTLLQQMSLGVNPNHERRKERVKIPTLFEAYEDYLRARKDLRPATKTDYARVMNTYLNNWTKKPLNTISKSMVEKKHQELGQRSPARVNNAMRVLRAIFNHARHSYDDEHGHPLITLNPVNRLSEVRAWYRIKPRERVIKTHQLKAWSDATHKLNSLVAKDYLQFLLFTGLRRTEASTLKWENIDFIGQALTILETKNHCTHTLPLTSFLLELLQNRKFERVNEYVFPTTHKRGYYKDPEMAIQKVIEHSNVEFSLHDLRRTFITIAESINIPAYTLKQLINHKDPNDVTARYIITDVERLRGPMEQLNEYLLGHCKLMS